GRPLAPAGLPRGRGGPPPRRGPAGVAAAGPGSRRTGRRRVAHRRRHAPGAVRGVMGMGDPGRPPPGSLAGVRDTNPAGRVAAAAYVLAAVLSLLIGAAAVVRTAGSLTSVADSDLANFFLKSAAYIVRGDPWHMYAVRASPPYATYPNVDPPLSIFLLAPLLRWASALGFARPLGARVAFVSLPLLPLVPLLGGLAAAALRSARPAAPAALRFLAFALIALGPLSWICYATWGHLEQP